jgi:hypothetical protein
MSAGAGRGERAARVLVTAVFAAIGIAIMTMIVAPDVPFTLRGLNDFPQLYFGPKLLATHDLYNPARMMELQESHLGFHCAEIQYVRLPYYAVLLWPLSLLPFGAAYVIWQCCSVGALAGFLRLWAVSRSMIIATACWFAPVWVNFALGQDVTFLLLWAGICAYLFRRGAHFEAGLVLTLCAAKFHLLLFLPVLILAGRRWKLGLGLVTGSSLLMGVSFLAAGWDWPLAWYRAVSNPATCPSVTRFSLLGRLSAVLGQSQFLVVAGVLILAVGCAVWLCARRADFRLALSVALAAGPLCAFHVYMQDCVLWLPLILIVGERVMGRSKRQPAAIEAGTTTT